jgi:hypothetical protein
LNIHANPMMKAKAPKARTRQRGKLI